ncbi:alpha/beta hydrolase-fold protein [Alteromonas sp. CYL-A6]|uniref:alpha/beta hydrolase-fold protein n=1 Tax=Alteromonas nitratireducens TaxID=3390813 RepID=UPI0034ACF7B9
MLKAIKRLPLYLLLLVLPSVQTIASEVDSKAKLKIATEVITPDSYDKNIEQKYPVVYLFDSAPFYLGSYFAEAKLALEQLAAQHSFPDVIIVNIKIESLYATVNAKRDDLMTWFQAELQPEIQANYRTLNKQVAVGFSYTGGWVAAELGLHATELTDVLSLSPVFDNTSYVVKPDEIAAPLPKLRIYFGNEHRRLEFQFASVWAEKKLSENLQITQLSGETHQSSFIPSLRHGLLAVFSDYRAVAYTEMSASHWTTANVEQFFKQREQVYSVKASDEEESDLHTSLAKAYTYAGKLELASEHWLKSASKHKGYFIAQIAGEVEHAGNASLALKIREHFKNMF